MGKGMKYKRKTYCGFITIYAQYTWMILMIFVVQSLSDQNWCSIYKDVIIVVELWLLAINKQTNKQSKNVALNQHSKGDGRFFAAAAAAASPSFSFVLKWCGPLYICIWLVCISRSEIINDNLRLLLLCVSLLLLLPLMLWFTLCRHQCRFFSLSLMSLICLCSTDLI